MGEPKKPQITEGILKLVSEVVNSENPETVVEHRIDQNVLDGGYLLDRVQWF